MSDRLLVLVRHGQSDWNLKNLFTGWKDPDLTEQGIAEAKEAGRKLKAQGLSFDVAFTSVLTRAQHTLDLMLEEIGQSGCRSQRISRSTSATTAISPASTRTTPARNGARSRCMIWRRSYDVPPPGGESLKDTLARALPYYVQEILPRVLRGERTLVAAHGNSLRALIMVLERLTPEQILKRELATGVPIDLPAQRGLHRRVEARSGGVSGEVDIMRPRGAGRGQRARSTRRRAGRLRRRRRQRQFHAAVRA